MEFEKCVFIKSDGGDNIKKPNDAKWTLPISKYFPMALNGSDLNQICSPDI